MPAQKYWLWLSSAEVSTRAKAAIVNHYGSAEAAFYAPEGEFKTVKGLTVPEAALLERRDTGRAAQIAEACDRQEIRIVTMQDAAYPKRLRNIFDPPPVLYVQGRLPDVDENALVAVIGTRKPSVYGLRMCQDLSYQIACCGGIVVSLLTQGIDREAAKGALLAGGKCIGVLGTPHEQEKSALAKEVAANGALISEYAPGTEKQNHFFRERNRVAAGISLGVVVVEAPEKSGTRLFVMDAIDQGKEIFAVPGNADAENSAGALALLKEGAKLVTSGAEVMSEFEGLYPETIHLSHKLPLEKGRKAVRLEPTVVLAREKRQPVEQKSVDKENTKGYIDWKEQLAALSETQLQIVTAIDKNSSHIDDIIEATGLSTATVLAQLTVLEIKGYVRREAGRRFALNIAKK